MVLCSSFVKHKHECFAEGPMPGFHANRNSLLGGWLQKKKRIVVKAAKKYAKIK